MQLIQETMYVTCSRSLRRAYQQYITVVNARSDEGRDQRHRWLWIQWSPDMSQLQEPKVIEKLYKY